MKLNALVAALAVTAAPLTLMGCAAIGALSGDQSSCSAAEKQLATSRAALILAQLAVTNAEAFGSPPVVQAAQDAVNIISADVNAIQTLVTSACAAPTTSFAGVLGPPVITLADAKRLAQADKDLSHSVSVRASR